MGSGWKLLVAVGMTLGRVSSSFSAGREFFSFCSFMISAVFFSSECVEGYIELPA